MSTEDDREKSREESPKWHRARAARPRANGFAKMAAEHEQIAEIIERRRRELPSSISGLTREAAAVTDGGHHDRISQHVVGRRSGLLPFLNPDEHSGCDRNSGELLARPLTPMHPHKLPWLSRR